MAAEAPIVSLKTGANTVLVQQNFNHWFQGLPGTIDVSVSYDSQTGPGDFEILTAIQDYPAHDQVTQTNFSLAIQLAKPSKHAVLRYRYISNNPDEIYPSNNTAAVFWQCADIAIVGSAVDVAKKQQMRKKTERRVRGDAKGCCVPPQFQISGREENAAGITNHQMYWDQTNGLVRWDKVLGQRNLTLWNNYTTNSEYVFDGQTCSLYGSDAFYGWCFGSRAGSWMVPAGSSGGVNKWTSSNGFQFGATQEQCLPAFLYRPGSTNITFTNGGPLKDRSVFALPAVCNNAHIKKSGCGSMM